MQACVSHHSGAEGNLQEPFNARFDLNGEGDRVNRDNIYLSDVRDLGRKQFSALAARQGVEFVFADTSTHLVQEVNCPTVSFPSLHDRGEHFPRSRAPNGLGDAHGLPDKFIFRSSGRVSVSSLAITRS